MKHYCYFSFPFLVLSTVLTLCQGLQIPVESSITEVTLFRDGALVTRHCSASVGAGKTSLVFKDLSSKIDTTTFRADFVGAENKGIIRNAKIYKPSDDQNQSTVVEEIQERLDAAEQESEKKNRVRSEAKEALEFASTIRNSFAKEFGKHKDGDQRLLDQAKELAGFVAETKAMAHSQIDAVESELKIIRKNIQILEKELDDTKKAAALLSNLAEVEVEMEAEGEVSIQLTYLVKAARWEPLYELRAYPDKGSLDFRYLASIWQDTGENWNNVTLSLQTNEANRDGNVPEPRPLHVRQIDDNGSRFASASSENYESSEMHFNFAQQYPSDGPVTVTESSVSFQATIPGQVTVPSSRQSSTYKVIEDSLQAKYWSQTAPRLQLDAYLRAKIRNTMGLPILPGKAIAFVNGKLSSKVYIDGVLLDEEAKISLGIDGNVLVKRTKGVLKDRDTGYVIIDRTKTLSREFVNEVQNSHPVDHKIIVVDQFPIARDEKIEIRRTKPVEGDEMKLEDENNGIFQWETTLSPKETKKFVTAYEVVYPRDWVLSTKL